MKVLLVDDDQAIQDVYSQVLRDADYEVINAVTGKEALEKARDNTIDLILLDEILPDMDGNNILTTLKTNEQTKNIPIAMLSNYNLDKIMKDAIEKGAVDYILKYDIDPSDIVKRVEQLVLHEKNQSPTFPNL